MEHSQELENRKQEVEDRMAREQVLEELLNFKPTLSDVDSLDGCSCNTAFLMARITPRTP